MPKLADFRWLGFLNDLTPQIVAKLGEAWGIPEWAHLSGRKDKPPKQDLKGLVKAIPIDDLDKHYTLADYADQIKAVGGLLGREELFNSCGEWFRRNENLSDQDLSVLAFLEQYEGFREALGWVQANSTVKWECYSTIKREDMVISKANISELENEICDYWQSKGLGGRCIIMPLHRDPVTVLNIDYEQDVVPVRQFTKWSRGRTTDILSTRPVRDALVRYDKSTGELKAHMYRGSQDKYTNLVRRTSEICFQNADLFETGGDRDPRYDLSKFSTRPAFLQDIDKSTGLCEIMVTKIVLEPPYMPYSTIEAKAPAKEYRGSGKDAYKVLEKLGDTSGWKVKEVVLKAYFDDDRRRKSLPYELRAYGGSTLAGDDRYEIIDDHLRKWKVLK